MSLLPSFIVAFASPLRSPLSVPLLVSHLITLGMPVFVCRFFGGLTFLDGFDTTLVTTALQTFRQALVVPFLVAGVMLRPLVGLVRFLGKLHRVVVLEYPDLFFTHLAFFRSSC